jgi:iron(III) transport system ATP-binding protein
VLLLDEPLSNLDAKLREEMRQEIKELVRRLETTTLYVTHDQLEALSMSDTVGLVKDGVLVQEGAPREVYLRPADPFAANFLGRTNLLDGRVVEGRVETRWGVLRCPLPPDAAAEGQAVTLGFRPEGVVLSDRPPPGADGSNVLPGTVSAVSFAGDTVEYQVDLGGRTIRAKGQPFVVYDEGTRVFAHVPAERCYVLGSSFPAAAAAPGAEPLPA